MPVLLSGRLFGILFSAGNEAVEEDNKVNAVLTFVAAILGFVHGAPVQLTSRDLYDRLTKYN